MKQHPSPTAALTLRDAAVGYGTKTVLSDLTLTVEAGEFVGIVGPSGAGKTTLLRLLTGSAQLLAGEAHVHGHTFAIGTQNRVSHVAYVPQLDQVDTTFPLTALEVVLFGAATTSRQRPWFSRHEKTAAHQILERLGIGDQAHARLNELSGGQRQRMFVARALFHDCAVLLLDEPTSGVDLKTRAEMLGLLGELHHEGLTVLLTTHDLNFVAAHLPRIVCVNGTIIADGAPNAILSVDVLERTYGHTLTVLNQNGRPVVIDPERIPLHSALAHQRVNGVADA